MSDLKIISIIPARGGSKGILRKNIKDLAGKPLIAHTIEQSVNSKLVSRTIVSTDDDEIAEISKKYGAEVIMRPDELAKPLAKSELAILHVLETLKKNENYEPEIVVLLQCTSPLRKKDDIDNAIKKLIDSEADSLLSVTSSHDFLWKFDEKNGTAIPENYDYKNRPMRQEMDPEYKENGSIYVTTADIWKEKQNRLGGKIEIYVMDEDSSVQADSQFDFWVIEQILKYKKK